MKKQPKEKQWASVLGSTVLMFEGTDGDESQIMLTMATSLDDQTKLIANAVMSGRRTVAVMEGYYSMEMGNA